MVSSSLPSRSSSAQVPYLESSTKPKPKHQLLSKLARACKLLAPKTFALKKFVSAAPASGESITNILSLSNELLTQIADILGNADVKILEITHPRFYSVCQSLGREKIDLYGRTWAERLQFKERPAEPLHWRLAEFMYPLIHVSDARPLDLFDHGAFVTLERADELETDWQSWMVGSGNP